MNLIPQLHECPDCGMGLEAGKDPNGLAWHRCEEPEEAKGPPVEAGFTARGYLRKVAAQDGPVTMAQAQDCLLRMALVAADENPEGLPALAGAIRSLAELKESDGEGGGDSDLLQSMMDWARPNAG